MYRMNTKNIKIEFSYGNIYICMYSEVVLRSLEWEHSKNTIGSISVGVHQKFLIFTLGWSIKSVLFYINLLHRWARTKSVGWFFSHFVPKTNPYLYLWLKHEMKNNVHGKGMLVFWKFIFWRFQLMLNCFYRHAQQPQSAPLDKCFSLPYQWCFQKKVFFS